MDRQEIIKYWLKGSKEALTVANDLYKSKHFHFCLFFCHLALEKLLKALVVKHTSKPAPQIHDLVKLAHLANLKPNSNLDAQLEEINSFNLETRYDSYKYDFYTKATKPYTSTWFSTTKQLINQFQKSL